MDPLYLTCHLLVDGDAIASDHTIQRVGPNAVALMSCSAELGLELQGVYLEAPSGPDILVAELWISGDQPASSEARRIPRDVPIALSPVRPLYDHLQRLQDLALQLLGKRLSVVDLGSAAAELSAPGALS